MDELRDEGMPTSALESVETGLEKKKLGSLEEVSRSSELVLSTVQKRLPELRRCAPRLSLCGIPDELIAIILAFATEGCESVVNVSLVCRRFRRIVLSSPLLWAACPIHFRMPPTIINMIASRSGVAGLEVLISEIHRYRISDHMESLVLLFDYAARWKTVYFNTSLESAQFIRSHFPSPRLDALQSLNVFYGNDVHNWDFHLYQGWSLPSLRILHDNSGIAPSLNCPRLIKGYLSSSISNLASVASFVSANASLETLHLSLQRSSLVPLSVDPTSIEWRVKSSSLRSLILHLPSLYKDCVALRIFPRIICPTITTLELFFWECEESADELICGFRGEFPLRSLCPCLKDFILWMTGCDGQNELHLFDDILHNLPTTIEDITIRTIFIPLSSQVKDTSSDDLEADYPHLRSLRMHLSSPLEHDFFQQLAVQLKRHQVKLKSLSATCYQGPKMVAMEIQEMFREIGVLCDADL